MTGTRYCTTQMLDSCNWVRGHFKLNVSRNYGYSKKWIVGQMPLGTKANQRAQLSAGMSASLDMYAQDIGVDVIPNWLFLFRSIFVRTSWPLYKHISSQSEMPVVSAPPPLAPNHHHPPRPGVRGREGVEDGWHLRLFSSIIVKNLDTIGFTACVKDLQPFDQHHDPITVHYIAFGGREIKDKLIYDRISLLSSKKGAPSVHCSPLFSHPPFLHFTINTGRTKVLVFSQWVKHWSLKIEQLHDYVI